MQPYPPLGSLYAASYLRQAGYQVALFDAMLAESEAEWEAALAHHRPQQAVLFEDNFNYLSKMCLLRMRQAAGEMIGMARRYGCQVIVAGADATDHPEFYLSQGADFVLLGEGEITLVELVGHQYGRHDLPLAEIRGLAYTPAGLEEAGSQRANRTSERLVGDLNSLPVEGTPGGVIRTPPRPDLRELDLLPFPAWDLVDIERYRRVWLERHGYFSLNMVTTRGCPFHCNWCAKPIWGQRYNTRSPENVAAELAQLKQAYQPDHIWFVDDIFGLQPRWVARFAEQVERLGVRTPFKSLNRVDLLLREGEIEALRRAGCQTVWVGAESGSQKILDAMEKGTRVEQIYAAARALHQAGIEVGFFLQFGYPGETRRDISRTFQMVRDCQPDDIGMSVSYPLPGTPFYERVRAEMGSQRNWYDSNDLAMLYHGPFGTAFYRQLHRALHAEFRAGRAWRRAWADGRLPAMLPLLRWVRHAARLPVERLRMNWLGRASQPVKHVLGGRA